MINPLDLVNFFPKKFQLTAAIAIVAMIGGGYVTYKYVNALSQVEIIKTQKQALESALSEMSRGHDDLKTKYDELEREYTEAIERYQKLSDDFTKINEEYREQMEVFRKKEDRFDDLLQKRTSRIVSLANAKVKRLREQLEQAINTDGAQERKD